MSLRTQSMQTFAQILQDRLDLATIVEVIAAPPSKPAQYPACSILVDSTDYWLADDFVPVDEDNVPLIGAEATMDLPFDWGRFDANTLIYNAGRYVVHCRIFVATRHPEQRADFEDLVIAKFLEDDLAPGRILFELDGPKVLGRQLPWSWPVAVFLPETDKVSRWTAEYAFDERLWAWIDVDVEVDILIPRQAPQITKLILEADVSVTADPTLPDTETVRELEIVQVDQSGDISAYP